MGAYLQLRSIIPVLGSVGQDTVKGLEDQILGVIGGGNTDHELEYNEASNVVHVFISGETCYSEATELDNIIESFYKVFGDQTMPVESTSELDGEHEKSLFAPAAVLLQYRINEAQKKIEELNQLIGELRSSLVAASTTDFEKHCELVE